MTKIRLQRAFSVGLAGVLALPTVLASEIAITDYTGLGFAPDLVTYELGKPGVKKVGLRDAEGTPVPCQISRDGLRVSFVAQVPHNKTVSWTVEAGKASSAKGKVSVEKGKKHLILRNDRLSVLIPPLQDKRFKTSVAANTLPAPIQGFTSWKSKVLGASKILSARSVSRLRVTLTETGGVYADALYEITWAEGGYYRCTVRVADGVPIAKITEEYDLGQLAKTDLWELELTKGWTPDVLETARPWGNGVNLDWGRTAKPESLSKQESWKVSPDNGHLGHVGLLENAARTANPDAYPMAGMVMLRKGTWRRMNALQLTRDKAGSIRVALPMSVHNVTWMDDTASVSSPYSTHSFDSKLSATYGRRNWGLLLAPVELPAADTAQLKKAAAYKNYQKYEEMPLFGRARALYGVVGLDRYKDFVLTWKDGGLTYPIAYWPGVSAEERRQALTASNLPEWLKKNLRSTFATYEADPQKATAARDRQYKAVMGKLDDFISINANNPAPSHHVMHGLYPLAARADDLLSQPGLPIDQRNDIRARLALLVYLTQGADYSNLGTGAHPGNPNMVSARFFSSIALIPLVADHPLYEGWKTHVADYAEYMLASQMAPGGGWVEYGTYHLHGFERFLNTLPALGAMKVRNAEALYDYAQADMDYFMNLLTPVDPRYGTRIIPGLANSGPILSGALLDGAGVLAKSHPETAAGLRWAWDQNGQNGGTLASVDPSVKGVDPKLESRLYPGFGVIFRAHQGPEETYMLLRSGFLWSHWYKDQGHFIMSSRGAPLVPSQPYQYYTSPNKGHTMYNTMRFGHPENEAVYGWPDANILEHSFGSSVEYAWASMGIPDWFITPGVSKPFQKKVANIPNASERLLDKAFKQKQGSLEWDRQVVFLKGKTAKSPNYFVFHDSLSGKGELATYLNLNLLGRKSDLAFKPGQIAVDTEFPVKLELFFPDRKTVKADLLEESHKPQFAGSAGLLTEDRGEEVRSRNWVSKDGKPSTTAKGMSEQHVFIRIAGTPGAGYHWVVWPRGEKEALPKIGRPADGVLKITHSEGVDYVFSSNRTMSYEGDGVRFSGRTGVVRVHGKQAILAMLSGSGEIGFKGIIRQGQAPFEVMVPLKGKETKAVAAAKPGVAIPAPQAGQQDTRYEIGSAESSSFTTVRPAEGVLLEGCRASIDVTGNSLRFVVPDARYAKLVVGNVGVRGVGPFDITMTLKGITGTVEGQMRTLVTTWPTEITRPMFHEDGRRWFAGFADDPSISKNTETPQFALAFAVHEGRHEIKVSEWTFPDLPPEVVRKTLAP